MTILVPPPASPSVDEAAFRETMARLASGVAIAACWDGAAPQGLLVSTLTALSTEPPRVLFCVKKTASAHGAFLTADECSLTLLGEEDRREAERFSQRERAHERFDKTSWRLTPGAPPRFRGGLARVAGSLDQRIDAGSHSIFILRVSQADAGRSSPLVYFDRNFHRLYPHIN